MKKLINDPRSVVAEMLEGMALANPGLVQLPGHSVIVRADWPSRDDRRAALISGGGSGHEPAHAGYVGEGMLTAAVAGEVFASPSPSAVLAAIEAVGGPSGVLLIIKNYTGDRLNFGLAAEMARFKEIRVETVTVADDVALAAQADENHAGRRGLAGTVLIHKIAGAAAESGASLEDVAAIARAAANELWTMGAALSPCTVPAAGRPGFLLGPDEVELGLGIHGEPGTGRSTIEPAEMIVNRILAMILVESQLGAGDRVALMVNNLGATPPMELAIVARSAIRGLESQGLVVERVYVGTFLTALDMAGASITVLRVDDQRLALLDAPTRAPAWPNASASPRRAIGFPATQDAATLSAVHSHSQARPPLTELDRGVADRLRRASQALIQAAPRLDERDRAVGDGDLGTSLARGAEAILQEMADYPLDDPAAVLHAAGTTLQHAMGGTSGPLYGVFLLRASAHLRRVDPRSPQSWTEAFREGCDGVASLGGASRGDRTMLDALIPAAEALEAAIRDGKSIADAIRDAAEAAEISAADTARLRPRRGRSSYLGDRAVGIPDPGAEAVAVWLKALT